MKARAGVLFLLLLFAVDEARSAGPLLASSLLSKPSIRQVAVNPAGTLVAANAYYDGTHGVLVQVAATGLKASVFSSKYPIYFHWADDDTLLIFVSRSVYVGTLAVDLKPSEWNLAPEEHRIRVSGWVVDPLPLVQGEVLWATRTKSDSRVYRTPISELIKPSGTREAGGRGQMPNDKYLLTRIGDPVSAWLSDRDGVPRAALVIVDDDPLRFELRYRVDKDARWQTIGSWEGEEAPQLAGIAKNGRDLLVLSDEGRDTVALREYRVDDRTLGEVVYADSRIDVAGVVWDYQGSEVIAVQYLEGGLRRYHHLDVEESQQQRWIESRFPETNVILTSRTASKRFATALVTGPRNPGRFYFVDTVEQKMLEVGDSMPWLSRSALVDVEAFEVETEDGLDIEAFLALPQVFRGDRPPLLVMPHGGPIGVRDSRSFDPTVQYLAGSGFAVLQVNYRGSAGRGAKFLEAGKKAWGAEIEDDIDAVVDYVVAEGRVDATRMCIFGASYGGYSALMSTTRRPQRYRCAAAFAAPTDLLLMFDSSDFAQFEEGRAAFAEIVGDPDKDREKLIEISPAYRASEMNVPILLIHGQDDRRVDVEHAHRMSAMLEIYQKPYTWMLIDGTPHSPSNEQWARIIVRVASFLREHLN